MDSNNETATVVVVLKLIEKDGWICEPKIGCGDMWHYNPRGTSHCTVCSPRSPDYRRFRPPAVIYPSKEEANAAATQMVYDLHAAQLAAAQRAKALSNLREMEAAGIPTSQDTGGDFDIETGVNKRRKRK